MATLPETPPTTNAGNGDRGTNAPTRTFVQTQSTSNANGNNVGIDLPDETGVIGPIRRNPETGELYNSGNLRQNPETGEYYQGVNLQAPTSAGVGQTDDGTAMGDTSSTGQAPSDDAASSYGGADQTQNDALNQALQQQKTQSGSIATDGSNQKITPQANILDKFSSYTYRASWYIMTPAQYKQLVYSKKKRVNGYMLLVQSGGAPQNTGGFKGALDSNQQTFYESGGASSTNTSIPGVDDPDAGRNPAFPLDFYIDNITIDNFLTGGGTRAPHAFKGLKFTVVENNGITLIDRLYEAVQDFMPTTGQNINYASVVYLMVIRFYGYDEQGNLVTGIGGNKSDSNSVIEKFIPFKITKCDWSIENKLVTYNIEGLSPGEGAAAGTRRGTIPYNIELTASTIGNLLGQDVVYSSAQAPAAAPGAATTSAPSTQSGLDATGRQTATTDPRIIKNTSTPTQAPPKADAAPTTKNGITQGLMGAMNQFQQDLVKEGVYQYPDTYEIVFADPGPGGGGTAIKNAKLIPPGTKSEKSQSAVGAAPSKDASAASMEKTISDTKTRNYAITAGMQIVQAIEIAIRNSTFITDQSALFFNEDDALQVKDDVNAKDIAWFNITFQAVQGEYDRKRNDYAQHITFTINTYTPVNFSSSYYPSNKFRGLHKQYNYWFTGKNNSVIEYKETMNNLYNLTISGDQAKGSLGFQQRQKATSSMRDQPFLTFQTASTENSAGSSGKQNEPQANLGESLYDPVGLANCNLKIVGDPAWIQQGSFAGGVSAQEFDFNPFLADGTINFDSREIMFEIAWQRPEDYDIDTGLADPYAKSTKRQPVQSRVYTAMQCTSEFRQGSFYQTIQGRLYFFMKPDAKNKAVTAPMPPATQADATRTDTSKTTSTNPSKAAADAAAAGNKGATGAKVVPFVPTKTGTAADLIPGNSYPVPTATTPPVPPTSNGVIASIKNFFSPPKLSENAASDVRAIDNAIIAGEDRPAFGRFRPPGQGWRGNPQVMAKDE